MRNRDLKAVAKRAPRQGPAPRRPALRRRTPRPDLADRPRRLHRHLRLQLPGVAVRYADDIFHAGAGAYSLFNTLMAVGSWSAPCSPPAGAPRASAS
ncbi:hypothetical protein ACRAWF_08375 [Streptomyces sp. L7]